MDEESNESHYKKRIEELEEEKARVRRQMILWGVPNLILWSPVIFLSCWFGIIEWLSREIYRSVRGFRPIDYVPKIGGDRLEDAVEQSIDIATEIKYLEKGLEDE